MGLYHISLKIISFSGWKVIPFSIVCLEAIPHLPSKPNPPIYLNRNQNNTFQPSQESRFFSLISEGNKVFLHGVPVRLSLTREPGGVRLPELTDCFRPRSANADTS